MKIFKKIKVYVERLPKNHKHPELFNLSYHVPLHEKTSIFGITENDLYIRINDLKKKYKEIEIVENGNSRFSEAAHLTITQYLNIVKIITGVDGIEIPKEE